MEKTLWFYPDAPSIFTSLPTTKTKELSLSLTCIKLKTIKNISLLIKISPLLPMLINTRKAETSGLNILESSQMTMNLSMKSMLRSQELLLKRWSKSTKINDLLSPLSDNVLKKKILLLPKKL